MGNIILFFILLVGSAFFSGMEAALFSVSRFRLKTLLFENIQGAKTLTKLRKNPHKTLAVLLFSNDLVNIGLVSVATIIGGELIRVHQLNTTWVFIGETIIMTSILLIFGEISPKVIAYSNKEFFSLKFGRIVEIISRIFEPVANFSEMIIRNIVPPQKIIAVSEEEIKYILNEAERSGVLDCNEKKLASRILNFGKTMVREIMTPKENAIGINLNQSLNEAKEMIRIYKHSRMPVYDNKGEVKGVLYAKDIFLQPDEGETKRVETIMRTPYFVQESKFVDDALLEFRKKGVHFGIVVNQKGLFVGIVTLGDILSFLLEGI